MSQEPETTESVEAGSDATPEAPTEAVEADGPEEGETAVPEAPELEEMQAEMDKLRDRHLRLAAEFDNYRKRMENELTGAWTRAQAELVGRLLEGLDDLQKVGAWEASNTTVEALIEGVDLVERKLFQALKSAGLEGVDPTGEAFDPNTMEAMMKVTAEDESMDNTVHQMFQKGYVFKGQLVRPARVSVLTYD